MENITDYFSNSVQKRLKDEWQNLFNSGKCTKLPEYLQECDDFTKIITSYFWLHKCFLIVARQKKKPCIYYFPPETGDEIFDELVFILLRKVVIWAINDQEFTNQNLDIILDQIAKFNQKYIKSTSRSLASDRIVNENSKNNLSFNTDRELQLFANFVTKHCKESLVIKKSDLDLFNEFQNSLQDISKIEGNHKKDLDKKTSLFE